LADPDALHDAWVYLYRGRFGAWFTNKRKPHATEVSSPRAKRYH
jgi:hypothetical protein